MKKRKKILIIFLITITILAGLYFARYKIWSDLAPYEEPDFTQPTPEQIEWLKSEFEKAGI